MDCGSCLAADGRGGGLVSAAHLGPSPVTRTTEPLSQFGPPMAVNATTTPQHTKLPSVARQSGPYCLAGKVLGIPGNSGTRGHGQHIRPAGADVTPRPPGNYGPDPGVLVEESDGFTDVAEGGAIDSSTITLLTEPTADVTIQVAPDVRTDVGAGAGRAITLTFTPANWHTPQEVRVSVPNDRLPNGRHRFLVSHTVASDDPNYHGLAVPEVIVQVSEGATGSPPSDADGDGFGGDADNCPDRFNPDQTDSDGDGVGDACENCPEDPQKVEPGSRGCGVPEVDSDGDGVADCVDNCPAVANTDQLDTDGDGVSDACEEPAPPIILPWGLGLCGSGAASAFPLILFGLTAMRFLGPVGLRRP